MNNLRKRKGDKAFMLRYLDLTLHENDVCELERKCSSREAHHSGTLNPKRFVEWDHIMSELIGTRSSIHWSVFCLKEGLPPKISPVQFRGEQGPNL